MVRNYEYLITTIHKYPWHAPQYVLLRERQAIFDAVLAAIRALVRLLHSDKTPGYERNLPTNSTLHELVVAALTCPGFSEGQKAAIAHQVDLGGFPQFLSSRGFNFHLGATDKLGKTDKYSLDWPFRGLIRKPGVDDKMIDVSNSLTNFLTDMH